MIRVPMELTEYKQWVLWKRVDMNGRTAKLPISAWSGKAAACDKPETWATFRHACYGWRKYNADGIGFVITAADPFCGVDIDDCRDAKGALTADAVNIVRTLDSYTELSPSGAGLHVIMKAKFGCNGRRTAGIEVYQSGRYFTVTGKRLTGANECIENRQIELDAILTKHFETGQKGPHPKQTKPRIGCPSDVELIRRAMVAKSGPRFHKLWNGDVSDYEGDHSRADAALCRMLSYWTGGDPTHIDRLFRLSGLMRDKWNRRTGDETYGMRTIRLSLLP